MLLIIIIIMLSCGRRDALACRPPGYGGGGSDGEQARESNNSSFFSSNSTWGGWSPPSGDDSWKQWLELWRPVNKSRLESTEGGGELESGWPTYWKNLGKVIKGVPPPPWALVPESYGKPQFCFLQPRYGNCNYKINRWGYNPTGNNCQTFQYSGCGGNQNNFNTKQDCIKACVEVPSTGCEDQAKVNFEELIYD